MKLNLPTPEGFASIVAALVAILSVVWPGHAISAQVQTAVVAGASVVLALFVHGRTTTPKTPAS